MRRILRLLRLLRWYCRAAHRDLWVWDHCAASWVCVRCRERWASPYKDGSESEVTK